MRSWLTTRRQVLTAGAGAALCLLSLPVGAMAGTQNAASPSSTRAVFTGNTVNNNGTDTCGYPDNSSAKSATVFNENETNQGITVLGSGASARIAVFGTDEASILLGAMATNPNGGNGSLVNPPLGNTSITDKSGRQLAPAIFVTDLTTGGTTSRAGDWQQGGAAASHIDAIYGSWTVATGDPNNNTYSAIKPNSQNSASSLPDPAPTTAKFDQYATEVVWNASSLGLITGHNYRFQVILHDGDQNKSGGDTGEACTTLSIPGPPVGGLNGHIYQCNGSSTQTTVEVPGGTVSFPNSGQTAAQTANPVALTNIAVGSYAANATAPAGYQFVTCGSTNYTIPTSTTATYTNQVPVTVATPGTAIFYVAPNATFKLAKSVSPSGPVAVGTPLNYTVTLTNLSASLAGDPGAITDKPSVEGAGVTFTAGIPTTAAGSFTPLTGAGGPAWSWTPGSVPAGHSVTFNVVLTPTSAGTAVSPAIDNTAYGTNTNCPNPGMPGCTTNTPLSAFSLSKTVTPTGPVTVGSSLTYTITVSNLTTTPGDPGVIKDDIYSDPANSITYVITSAPASNNGTTVNGSDPHFTWDPGTLAATGTTGATAKVTLTIKVTGVTTSAAASILNTAYNTNTNCPTPGNPTCTPSNPVTTFQMSKTVSPTGPVTIGATLTYTVTVTNTTGNAGDPGTVNDQIESNGVNYTVTGQTGGTKPDASGAFTWAPGTIAGHGSASITLTLHVDGIVAGTTNPTIANSAWDTVTNCAVKDTPACTPSTPLIVLTLTKTVLPTSTPQSPVPTNSTLTYTITIHNAGAAAATNVLVDDVFGGDAGYLVNDGTNGTTNSFAGTGNMVGTVTKSAVGHYQWTYASINPGETDVVQFTTVIQLPSTVVPTSITILDLTNTVSIPNYTVGVNVYTNPGNNPPPVTVTSYEPNPGQVLGCSTSSGCGVPSTGASLNVTLAGFLFLGGLGLLLIGVLARKPEETIA